MVGSPHSAHPAQIIGLQYCHHSGGVCIGFTPHTAASGPNSFSTRHTFFASVPHKILASCRHRTQHHQPYSSAAAVRPQAVLMQHTSQRCSPTLNLSDSKGITGRVRRTTIGQRLPSLVMQVWVLEHSELEQVDQPEAHHMSPTACRQAADSMTVDAMWHVAGGASGSPTARPASTSVLTLPTIKGPGLTWQELRGENLTNGSTCSRRTANIASSVCCALWLPEAAGSVGTAADTHPCLSTCRPICGTPTDDASLTWGHAKWRRSWSWPLWSPPWSWSAFFAGAACVLPVEAFSTRLKKPLACIGRVGLDGCSRWCGIGRTEHCK